MVPLFPFLFWGVLITTEQYQKGYIITRGLLGNLVSLYHLKVTHSCLPWNMELLFLIRWCPNVTSVSRFANFAMGAHFLFGHILYSWSSSFLPFASSLRRQWNVLRGGPATWRVNRGFRVPLVFLTFCRLRCSFLFS